jgi:proteic killer suppression protein
MIDDARFKDKKTEQLFYGQHVKGFPPDLSIKAQKKLLLVFAAKRVEDLAFPPGNNLEKLGGDRKGFWSIRINRQWRICFEWRNGQTASIQVIDYH